MDLSRRIKNIREDNGIKQYEIAERLGIERQNYSRLEKRGDKLTLEQIKDIADALQITLKELLFSENSTDMEREVEFVTREFSLVQKELEISEKAKDLLDMKFNLYHIENLKVMQNLMKIKLLLEDEDISVEKLKKECLFTINHLLGFIPQIVEKLSPD